MPRFDLAYEMMVSGQVDVATMADWLSNPMFRRYYETRLRK